MTRGRSHRKHCRSHVAFVETRSGTYSQYLLYIIHTKNCFKNSALCSTNISALLASAAGCGRINVACAHCSGAHSRVRALQAMPGTVPGESPRFANDQFYLVPVDSFMWPYPADRTLAQASLCRSVGQLWHSGGSWFAGEASARYRRPVICCR